MLKHAVLHLRLSGCLGNAMIGEEPYPKGKEKEGILVGGGGGISNPNLFSDCSSKSISDRGKAAKTLSGHSWSL